MVQPYRYTGTPSPSFEEDLLYSVTVSPADSPSRTFVAEYYDLTWELMRGTCFYAGTSQGGAPREFEEPNDSVIEGNFRDYRTQGIYDTDFKYDRFDSSLCA